MRKTQAAQSLAAAAAATVAAPSTPNSAATKRKQQQQQRIRGHGSVNSSTGTTTPRRNASVKHPSAANRYNNKANGRQKNKGRGGLGTTIRSNAENVAITAERATAAAKAADHDETQTRRRARRERHKKRKRSTSFSDDDGYGDVGGDVDSHVDVSRIRDISEGRRRRLRECHQRPQRTETAVAVAGVGKTRGKKNGVKSGSGSRSGSGSKSGSTSGSRSGSRLVANRSGVEKTGRRQRQRRLTGSSAAKLRLIREDGSAGDESEVEIDGMEYDGEEEGVDGMDNGEERVDGMDYDEQEEEEEGEGGMSHHLSNDSEWDDSSEEEGKKKS